MLTAGTKLQSVSEVELFEASEDSEWFDAIEKKNCKLLLQLFRSDRSLWVQTGLKGRSVLHVSVMQGCSELVRELHYYEGDLVPCGKNWRTPFEFLWENARDGRLKDASARDVWYVMEGPSVKYRNDPLKFFREPFIDRSRDDYIQSHVRCSMPVDSEMLSLREAISSIAMKEDFVMDENDVDFNFENVERKELYVHMACSRLRNVHNQEDWKRLGCDHIVEFIIAVLTDLCEKNLLKKLFDQKDAQGRTVLQVFVLCDLWQNRSFECSTMCSRAFKRMLAILPDACVNTPDTAGRTVLHWAVAHEITGAVEELLESGKARPDVTFHTAYIRDITAFHLFILYEHMLPDFFYFNYLKDELKRDFCNFALILSPFGDQGVLRGPVAWAILMGRNKFVKQVMEIQGWRKLYPPKDNELLAVAAYTGSVEILQHVLQEDDVDKVNVVCAPFGAPPLHLAVRAKTFWRRWSDSRTFDDWLDCTDFISIELLEKKLGEKDPKEYSAPNRNQYSAKQVCANLLLQAGADIFATDMRVRMADPGEHAPNEAITWWYELVAKETVNIKNDLNAAGTGTAVVATLVATASFVGPLTPPLNYVAMSSGTATVDVGVQVTEFMIRVFLVSNGLSFYLAITSIMLAIMPSLPIPKQSLMTGPPDDLIRSRRTISIAIGMLLASIISVLISFAASSLAVIPLQHRGLMAYSTSIGGLICCIGIFFFFLRFLRLICPQNMFITKLYKRIGKL
jgi:ankyrin repeat protein